ncbi:MAG: thioredoxin family protein [Pseudomonadota bacterium]
MIHARFFPLSPKHFAACLCALIASVLLAQGAWAQTERTPPYYGDDNISVELYSEGAWVAGEVTWYALRFSPSSAEWHGYWSNPGDAGQGMRLDLQVPDDWTVGEPVYPVPSRLMIGDLMNHIYEGDYTVLVPVTVGPSVDYSDMVGLKAYVEYLACTDRVCVPQDAVLEELTGIGDFPKWRAQVAPLLDAQSSFERTGTALRLAIPLPESVELSSPHAFIANEELVDYAAAQVFRRSGDIVTVDIPLKFTDTQPEAIEGILAFGEETGVRFAATPGDVPTGGEQISGPIGPDIPPFWTLALGALVGGLILNIMPCVFPILSLKALSLARAGESEAAARVEGLAYTAGVVLACVALGAVMLALRAAGEQVGWAFQLQEPSVVIVLLVLAAAITANFAGVFELPSIDTGSGAKKGAGGAFATGLLAAFAATPCTGPFMAAALGAALLLPTPMALMLFAMLGLGLALPFLALGFVPALRNRLPKPGAWMDTFRRVMAIPMGLTALALIWLTAQLGGKGFAMFALVMTFGVILALFIVGKLQRSGKMAWPAFALVAAPFLVFGSIALPASFERPSRDASTSLLAAQEFSSEALTQARASGQPVFLYFTADWCVTCKVNESVAIEREATAEAFEQAGVIAMVGDWTVRDEAITAFLTKQGAAGVPLYLWYEPGGEAEQLPQVLTPDTLTELAKRQR